LKLYLCFCAAAALLIAGCASRSFYAKINASSAGGRYEAALQEIESNRKKYYPKNDTLLYFLDKGMLSHLAGKYSASNAAFEKAKRLAEKLYTKSVSAEGVSLLTNDSQKPYDGEDYEIAMIYLIKALNYAALGDEGGALVEIRQLNHFLKTISISRGSSAAHGIKPGALYFAGIIRESAGDINGAVIDYKNALASFEKTGTTPPRGLIESCYAAALKMGFRGRRKSSAVIAVCFYAFGVSPAFSERNFNFAASFYRGGAVHMEDNYFSGAGRINFVFFQSVFFFQPSGVTAETHF